MLTEKREAEKPEDSIVTLHYGELAEGENGKCAIPNCMSGKHARRGSCYILHDDKSGDRKMK